MAVGYTFSLMGDFHLAEDAALKAFIHAYLDLSKLREPAALPGWFRQILFSQCNRYTRRKRIQTLDIDDNPDIASHEKGPAEQMEDIHFSNADQPRSPFAGETRGRTAGDLLSLLSEADERYTNAELVQCGSWLCCFPPFLKFFPKEFTESYVPVFDYYGTYGWWGQYMDHRGAFNVRNGSRFRQTRNHPFAAGIASCPIEHVLKHLEAIV